MARKSESLPQVNCIPPPAQSDKVRGERHLVCRALNIKRMGEMAAY